MLPGTESESGLRATGPGGNSASYVVLFTLLVLVLAILIQQSFGEELLRAARMAM